MVQITKLNETQVNKLASYRDEALAIGRATGGEINMEFVHELMNLHREICGLQPVKEITLYDSPFQACQQEDGVTVSNALYGQYDIHWLQFYQFFRTECGLVEETEKIKYLYELAKIAGWMWMTSTKNIVTRRPESINLFTFGTRNEIPNMLLHNENGPALTYRDGFCLYALNGMRLSANQTWIVTTPADQLDINKILEIENTEIRSAALRKVGIERALEKLNKKQLHTKTFKKGGKYKLYKVIFPNGLETTQLAMTCPSSGKFHLEEVPPECLTVDMALNWRETGTFATNYIEPLERT